MSSTRFTCEQLESRRLLSLVGFNMPHDEVATGVTPGPHNTLWTSDANGPHIVLVDAAGRVRQFTLPAADRPTNLTVGPDGNIWFIDDGHAHHIGRIKPSGAVREFRVPGYLEAYSLVAGPDGSVWFSANVQMEPWTQYYYNSPTVGSLSPKGVFHTYSAVQFPFPPGFYGDLAFQSDGTLNFAFFSQILTGNQSIRMNTAGDVLSIGPYQDPGVLAADGNRYTYSAINNGIVRVNADFSTTLVAPTSLPIDSVFAGPFGKLWFHDSHGDIGYMNPDGTLTLDDPPNGVPVSQPVSNGDVLWMLPQYPGSTQIERFDPLAG